MDIAVVVNLRARRGSEAIAASCRRALPNARVVASRSMEQTRDFVRDLVATRPDLVVAAGGDGTAIGLVNVLRDVSGGAAISPELLLGVLPLGTGNAWARVTGARNWRTALDQLGAAAPRARALPRRRFDLVEVLGRLGHFAGTGWDAEMIDDFHAQQEAPSPLPRSRRNGLAGYLNGMFTRTIPRHVFGSRVEVELVNTGDDALYVDDEGRARPLAGGEHGSVLYRGPTSVCAAGTAPEWGFGFRAFPFAGLVPGRFCMRVYAGTSVEATLRMGRLWRGEHPLEKMHSWLLTRCSARFSRPVPFQVGGDRLGQRDEVEYAIAPRSIDLLDWSALS